MCCLHTQPPQEQHDANNLIDEALATAIHATRAAAHSSLNNNFSQGAIIYQRDMFLDKPPIVDIQATTSKREAITNTHLLTTNNRRLNHDYQPGEIVLIRVNYPDKLLER
jgi:hypothetical protein